MSKKLRSLCYADVTFSVSRCFFWRQRLALHRSRILATQLLVSLALAGPASAALADVLTVHSMNASGMPGFVTGNLGVLRTPTYRGPNLSPTQRAASNDSSFKKNSIIFMTEFVGKHYSAAGSESFKVKSVVVDGVGQAHVRFKQFINNKRVYGAQMTLHVKTDSGIVYAVNGEFARGSRMPNKRRLKTKSVVAKALNAEGIRHFTVKKKPRLAYVLTENGKKAKLAYRARIQYAQKLSIQTDDVFVDALSGKFITSHPRVKPLAHAKTYDAKLRPLSEYNPRVVCVDYGLCPHDVAQTAQDNTMTTRDFLLEKFGRDSFDGNGRSLLSVVNYRKDRATGYNNAYWNGAATFYGDGDGYNFTHLGNSLDIVAHEFGHAITDSESGLIYKNESGALNEAWSDIFGAAVEAWKDGGRSNDTWKLAEDSFTPSRANDAMRYMNDPTRDGYSTDYYPERFIGDFDNGGVHLNSGIANLAFVLLVEGGRHPRNKTSVSVPSIGMEKAVQIFHRAQTTYLTESSTFESARYSTVQSAKDLYGETAGAAVHKAWDAVGVPGSPPSRKPYAIRINAGGGEHTDTSGNYWYSDRYYLNGYSFSTSAPIPNARNDYLFQTERWAKSLNYNIPLVPGRYQVRIHMAEIYHGSGGERVFSVVGEDTIFAQNLDVFRSAGGKNRAYVLTKTLNVTDGVLNLRMAASVDNSKISAIELLPVESEAPQPENFPTIRINAGGPQFTDRSGASWEADRDFNGGSTYSNAVPIGGALNDGLFQTERWGSRVEYRIPVPAGRYSVELFFAEIYHSGRGQRVFDGYLENRKIFDDLDLVAARGARHAMTVQREVNVSDGKLDIVFDASVDHAKVSAIRVTPIQ